MKPFALLNSILISLAMMILAFAVLSWAKVPVGSLSDWVGGLLAFFWLVAIVTVPWNIYFKAKAVLSNAQPTRDRGLPVDEHQVAYVRKLATLSFWVAIGLHLASALVLYILARPGVVRIGYIASVIALMLTVLRPSISAYEYLAARLHAIGQGWVYPVEDVVELRGRLTSLEATLKSLQADLDPQKPDSLLSTERAFAQETRRQVVAAAADLEAFQASNAKDHERLSEEARSAISQLTTDGQFLDHVREILRFFKSA
jgi:hypothetical protein